MKILMQNGGSFVVALVLTLCWGIPASTQQPDLSTARAARLRGAEGRRITVVCPPGSKPEKVWGTDVFTDDSSICSAAAHAGIIRLATGGVVSAVTTTGRPSYLGSTKNGITSLAFGPYANSFTVEDGDGGQIDWSTKAVGIASISKPLTLVCPPAGSTSARVWGTDAYTEDTSICAAAVHTGVITAETGGRVVVESAAGRTSYRGTNRNGVSSETFGVYPRSFRFTGVVVVSEAELAKVASPSSTLQQPGNASASRISAGEPGPVSKAGSATIGGSLPVGGNATTAPAPGGLVNAPPAPVAGQLAPFTRSFTTGPLLITGTAVQQLIRSFSTGPLLISSTAVQQLTRSFSTGSLAITGTAVQQLTRTFTTAILVIQSQ